MEQEHERAEELLAGYTLRALSGEDAAEADRLLTEHVPACASCRQTLSDLRSVAGELALGADPLPPSDLVWARIDRALHEDRGTISRGRRGSFVAVAAGLVAVMAMGGLSFLSTTRASRAEGDRTLALELLSLMRSPNVEPVSVDPQGGAPAGSGFVAAAAPDVHRLYLVAEVCPEPRPGHAYQLWLGSDGVFTPVGEPFSPSGGSVLIKLTVDVARFDTVWITEERVGELPAAPSAAGRSWRAELG
ncbi:MAG TPA: anti-sigma factor [Actinomycetota bacterium]|nr:anti-sigma factor [Actinomycetota bacterium]